MQKLQQRMKSSLVNWVVDSANIEFASAYSLRELRNYISYKNIIPFKRHAIYTGVMAEAKFQKLIQALVNKTKITFHPQPVSGAEMYILYFCYS